LNGSGQSCPNADGEGNTYYLYINAQSVKLKIIKTKKEYESCLAWADEMFDKKVKPNSEEGETLQIMLLLIKQYEDLHYPIPKPNQVEAVKMKMQEMGLKNKDFVGKIGTKGYVSAVFKWQETIHARTRKTVP
jgi:HTH-type transcriptional regulator / antitoxin HigA